jgi:hypothetical protein
VRIETIWGAAFVHASKKDLPWNLFDYKVMPPHLPFGAFRQAHVWGLPLRQWAVMSAHRQLCDAVELEGRNLAQLQSPEVQKAFNSYDITAVVPSQGESGAVLMRRANANKNVAKLSGKIERVFNRLASLSGDDYTALVDEISHDQGRLRDLTEDCKGLLFDRDGGEVGWCTGPTFLDEPLDAATALVALRASANEINDGDGGDGDSEINDGDSEINDSEINDGDGGGGDVDPEIDDGDSGDVDFEINDGCDGDANTEINDGDGGDVIAEINDGDGGDGDYEINDGDGGGGDVDPEINDGDGGGGDVGSENNDGDGGGVVSDAGINDGDGGGLEEPRGCAEGNDESRGAERGSHKRVKRAYVKRNHSSEAERRAHKHAYDMVLERKQKKADAQRERRRRAKLLKGT